MARGATSSKPFRPGTTGWTASDLDDPRIEGKWLRGSYEIVEGVLTRMPPAYFIGGESLFNVMFLVRSHQERNGIPGSFSSEVDIIINEERVAKADAVWMTPRERLLQAEASRDVGRPDPDRTRILVPPSLVIESIRPGHERHDRNVKRKWYAEFGVPNYWLLNAYEHSLELLVLDGGAYRADCLGAGEAELRPAMFPGLVLPLARVWGASTPQA
jgi:Uma2 family endonuclease